MSKLTIVPAKLTSLQVSKLKAEHPEDEQIQSIPDKGLAIEIQYPFGEDLSDAMDIFGEDVCLNLIQGHAKFGMQARIRNLLAAGKSQQEVQSAFYDLDTDEYNWKPGMAPARKTPAEKEIDRIRKIDDPEERKRQADLLRQQLAELED